MQESQQKIKCTDKIKPNLIPLSQKRILMKSFIESQFSYCPLVWMFCDRNSNNKINRIHERALRIVYNDNTSSFEELLLKDRSVSIHYRNIQIMAIEICKTKHKIGPTFLNDIFQRRVYEGTELRSNTDFLLPEIRSVREELKHLDTLEKFKSEIKLWIPSKCDCKLCKTYVKDLGHI